MTVETEMEMVATVEMAVVAMENGGDSVNPSSPLSNLEPSMLLVIQKRLLI